MTYNSYKPSGYTNEDWSELVNEGWKPIMRGLQMVKTDDVVLTQVKEKFGLLRIYYDGGDEGFRAAVRLAGAISGFTCEVCGKPGERWNEGGHIRTVCPEHQNIPA
jgi:hypothetical protein